MVADSSLDLEADVLKVAHHGSKTSTSSPFLSAVTPQEAVISVGASNSYGHPTQETLDRLAAEGVTVYRTDLVSTVLLTSDCSTYSLSTAGATPTPVGGIAELPDVAGTPLEAPESSGTSVGQFVAAALAAAVVALAAGAWYGRRRSVR